MKRILSILLCLVLLLSLSACGGASQEDAPTEAATQAATEAAVAPPTPQEVYAEAVKQLESLDAMVLEINTKTTLTVGPDTFLDSTSQTLTLQGIGSDAFTASVEQTTTMGTYSTSVSEYYTGGTLYYGVGAGAAISKDLYSTSLSAEEYLARFTPATVLNADLYATVEQPAQKSLRFSDATALESWLYCDGMELIEASGSVVLNDDGTISRSTYDVSFTYGPALYDMELSVNISPDAGQPISAPEDLSTYTQLEDYRGPLLLEQAKGLTGLMDSVTLSTASTGYIQASDLTFVFTDTIQSYGEGDTLCANMDFGYLIAEQGDTSQGNQNIHFEDGVYTTHIDDAEPVEDPYGTESFVTGLIRDYCHSAIPNRTIISDYTITDLPGFLLLEYTFSPEAGEDLATGVVGQIYEDPNLLADLSTNYKTETATGYIGFEKTTGLPVSINLEFSGYYTIDGQDYAVIEAIQQTIMVGQDSAYTAVTGQTLPVQTLESPTPLFYQVTGAEGQQMWLMGTIHVGDERTANLPTQITEALTSSDALAVEFDTDAYMEEITQDEEALKKLLEDYLYTDGTTLKDHLQDQELYDTTIALLKATGSYNATALLSKPFMLSQQIDHANMAWGYKLSSEYGVDAQLMKLAREAEIEIRDVESGEAQMDMMAGFSDALQELLLKGSVYTDHLSYNQTVEEMYELWCAGDESALIQMIIEAGSDELTEEEKPLYEEYNTAIGSDRNADMLEVATGYLESGDVVFYAVGLAHLLAEDGLVNALRDAGYTVELIPLA